jgi:alpha-L-fucosidase 2
MFSLQKVLVSILFLLLFAALPHYLAAQKATDNLLLWYTQPAKNWNEALPVGNGSLGGMVFGQVDRERIQLNEKTVWAGGEENFVNPKAKSSLPKVRALLFDGKYDEARKLAQETLMGNKKGMSAYQTLGDLYLDFKHSDEVTNYRRDLDLDKAVASVSYSSKGIDFSRAVFSSAPDDVMVIHLSASKPGAITYKLAFRRPGDRATISYSGNEVSIFEHVNGGNGVRMAAKIAVLADGGKVTAEDDGILIEAANESMIIIAAATDYYGNDPSKTCSGRIAATLSKKYDNLLSSHISDYQSYFRRVKLDLGRSEAAYFPTDLRINALQRGSNDPQLVSLYYQFGRYLLISSSRPGSLPANLQGLWADGLNPPWDADYHININIQMNYWPAEVTNLAEMHQPFFQFLDSLRDDGRRTAKDMYSARGVVAHFTTDAFYFTEPYGQTQWAMWPMGYAWSVQHLWEHFLFNEDRDFLKRQGYPLMKDAALFCLDWLVVNPQSKKLVSGPSISPENTFRTRDGKVATMVMGPTMDHMIIRQLFQNTMQAAVVLGVDAAFQKQLSKALRDLAPTKLTSDGRIMEWTEEFEEPEPGHRHISHLYGLHPGNEINRNSDQVMLEAARKTIEFRLKNGGGHTGWSRAWIINFFARLQDGEKAHFNLLELLKKSTLPNLFDNHPPFQIDGNFGGTAGITEMLLQSHAREVVLLPSLPSQWKEGSVSGLRARGGFEVEMAWKDKALHNVTIKSHLGNTCELRYNNKTISLPTNRGSVYVLNSDLEIIPQ